MLTKKHTLRIGLNKVFSIFFPFIVSQPLLADYHLGLINDKFEIKFRDIHNKGQGVISLSIFHYNSISTEITFGCYS